MTILMFYGSIPCLNYFTDDLEIQFRKMGHEVRIIDLNQDGSVYFAQLLEVFEKGRVDVAICYNFIGSFYQFEEKIYDKLNIPVINILIDHPMNMRAGMLNLPRKYIQLSLDENHVLFAKKFYDIKNVYFLPHMASLSALSEVSAGETEQEEYIIYAPLTYIPFNEKYQYIKETFSGDLLYLALRTMEYVMENSSSTLENALEIVLKESDREDLEDQIAAIMNVLKPVDMFIRGYFRYKVVNEIVMAGLPITVVGQGWEDCFQGRIPSNLRFHPSIAYKDRFACMQRAQITLTVLPWLKAGGA